MQVACSTDYLQSNTAVHLSRAVSQHPSRAVSPHLNPAVAETPIMVFVGSITVGITIIVKPPSLAAVQLQ